MLVCTVRGCGLPLTLDERRYVCPRAHSFDRARSGYVNLLQPQERRSKEPGDSAEMVAARRRLHDAGVTKPLLASIAGMLAPGAADLVLEVGCGDGFYLGSLAAQYRFAGHGVDISTPAIDAAARRHEACEWVVANADRSLPYSDRSFTIVMSIAARMNVAEFRRVLCPGGRLLIAVPAPDDLIELRGAERDRVPRTVAEFSERFALVDQRRATSVVELSAEAVDDVRKSIYRPMPAAAARAMRVTFSLDLLLFS